jgi:hypothetical protein
VVVMGKIIGNKPDGKFEHAVEWFEYGRRKI